MKKQEKMNIVIEGNERNRSEIIYNNVLDKLDTKEQKIEYLKEKLTIAETENQTRLVVSLISILGTLGLIISFVLTTTNLFYIGVVLGFLVFFASIWVLYKQYQKVIDFYKSDKFEKVNNYFDLLNKKLK